MGKNVELLAIEEKSAPLNLSIQRLPTDRHSLPIFKSQMRQTIATQEKPVNLLICMHRHYPPVFNQLIRPLP